MKTWHNLCKGLCPYIDYAMFSFLVFISSNKKSLIEQKNDIREVFAYGYETLYNTSVVTVESLISAFHFEMRKRKYIL